MKKNISKILAVAAVTLFMFLSFTPATNAVENKKALNLVEVEVTDYNADGTTDTRIVLLEKSTIKNLKEDILSAESLSERLEVYKEYNLVSKDTNIKDWYNGMLEKADKLGIKDKNFLTKTKIKLPIMLRALTKVDSISIIGGSKRIGITPLIKLIGRITKLDLPRADILITQTGLINILNSKGIISNSIMLSLLGFNTHVGFVGTGIKIPFLLHIHSGYSALTFGIGLGLKIRSMNITELIQQ